MPVKNHIKLGRDEIKKLFKDTGLSRVNIVQNIDVTIGALNKWVNRGDIPEDQLKKLTALIDPLKSQQLFPEDFFGQGQDLNTKPLLYESVLDKNIYRTVGRCINNDTKELAILYRKWNDFGDSFESLYCRDYKNFHKYFKEVKYQGIKIDRTLDDILNTKII